MIEWRKLEKESYKNSRKLEHHSLTVNKKSRKKAGEVVLTFEEFEEMADKIVREVPEEFYQWLSGGVHIQPGERLHPVSQENVPVYIMGLYTKSDILGCHIDLYYGSFAKVYGEAASAWQEEKLREILLHELRHHIELLCGIPDLIIEDEKSIEKIKERLKQGGDNL